MRSLRDLGPRLRRRYGLSRAPSPSKARSRGVIAPTSSRRRRCVLLIVDLRTMLRPAAIKVSHPPRRGLALEGSVIECRCVTEGAPRDPHVLLFSALHRNLYRGQVSGGLPWKATGSRITKTTRRVNRAFRHRPTAWCTPQLRQRFDGDLPHPSRSMSHHHSPAAWSSTRPSRRSLR